MSGRIAAFAVHSCAASWRLLAWVISWHDASCSPVRLLFVRPAPLSSRDRVGALLAGMLGCWLMWLNQSGCCH